MWYMLIHEVVLSRFFYAIAIADYINESVWIKKKTPKVLPGIVYSTYIHMEYALTTSEWYYNIHFFLPQLFKTPKWSDKNLGLTAKES